MKWRRAVIYILRAIRSIMWATLGGLAIDDLVRFQRLFARLEGAPQQCALAGSVLVELLVGYIVARSADRVFALWSERLKEALDALPQSPPALVIPTHGS